MPRAYRLSLSIIMKTLYNISVLGLLVGILVVSATGGNFVGGGSNTLYGSNSAGKGITESLKGNGQVALSVSPDLGGDSGTFVVGQKITTVSTTPVQITPTSTIIDAGAGITIKAKVGTTGTVCLGTSTSTASCTGTSAYRLTSTTPPITLHLSNLNLIYVGSTVNSEGIEYVYED